MGKWSSTMLVAVSLAIGLGQGCGGMQERLDWNSKQVEENELDAEAKNQSR